ncbi:V-set domain-containing T-cell activation inhibitor 1 [Trichomycterus rosablanca]|uniref:V-set domain-containing T-cell activation inhibitor 1 n=1 Tax=Trichomycterus rosablanca TaxID=2290929 RepID=UPI002F353392
MASLAQIIFWSMIVLIFAMAVIIILLLVIAFSGNHGIVTTNNNHPVGNLGQDVLLDCSFQTKTEKISTNDVSITWTKQNLSGTVYQYNKNAVQLQDQNSQFQDRSWLFPPSISTGNASLLLSSVRLMDEGLYDCSVNAPGVFGTVRIDLRVGAFSAPTITKSNNSLTAVAMRWLPKPEVTWSYQNGTRLNSSTQFNTSSSGIVEVLSILQHALNEETYTCVIQNFLVTAVTEASVSGDEVSTKINFIYNSSPKINKTPLISAIPILLSMLVW